MIGGNSIGLVAVAILCSSGRPSGDANAGAPGPHRAEAVSAPSPEDTVPRAARVDTTSGGRRPADTSAIVTPDVPDERSHWLQDFDRRSSSNKLGYFLNEEQIKAAHPQYTSDALRRVPGVLVLPARGVGNAVRIRGCAPLIWVDGQRAPGAELDEVTHENDVAALEVYRSLAGVPAEFTDRSATCGTILVWLKSG